MGPPENVREAIEQMKVERIGHGYAAFKDEQVYEVSLIARGKSLLAEARSYGHFINCLKKKS